MWTVKNIEADQFGISLRELFGSIDMTLSTELDEPVLAACKAAKKTAKAAGTYKDRPTARGTYRSGFDYRVNKSGKYECIGYVGNRKKPGLVHLLEKGHATMNGGRTRAFVHMKTGADKGEEVLIAECGNLADRALR